MIHNSSAPTHVASGVPQGSVLGTLLFSIYSPHIANSASTFSVPQQQFADDSQLYFSLSPFNFHRQIYIVLKIVSLPCTPGVVITPFPSILINLTLFSSELGNALILSRTSQRSTLRARLFQRRTSSGYSASHLTIACWWTSTWTKSVARVFTTSVHCDIFDHPSPSATPTWNMIVFSVVGSRLAARLRQRRVVWHIVQEYKSSSTHPKCAYSMRLGLESSLKLKCTATSTTSCLPIRYRIDFKLAKLAFLARSSYTSS